MNFPLVLWENTEEYKKEKENASQRLEELKNKIHAGPYVGSLRFDENCVPEIWMNDLRLGCARGCANSSLAQEYALRYGNSGWWSLDELEQFTKGKGPIFEDAMWELGYRRHKSDPTKWAKKSSKDERDIPIPQKQIRTVLNDEYNRLNKLWSFKNESAGMGETYCLDAGKSGLIYIELWVNPFAGNTAETIGILGEQMRQRAHIAKKQEGFEICAENVKLGKEKGIYINAVNESGSKKEVIWPTRIPNTKLVKLAADLVSRVNNVLSTTK